MGSLKLALICLTAIFGVAYAGKDSSNIVTSMDEVKELQRILKLRTNVMVIATKSGFPAKDVSLVLNEVAKEMKGIADLVTVDCSQAKKVCKKYKFTPHKVELYHFADAKFNKVYDRPIRTKSLINFLKAPNEDAPWSEDPGASDVIHIEQATDLMSVFKREKRPVFLMFYAPWCGHCKAMKPEFASAATLLKKDVAFVGVDCQKAENYPLQQGFNVSGFPTMLLMRGGDLAGRYIGGPKRDVLIEWLSDPQQWSVNPEPPAPPPEEPWAEHIEMLTKDNFDDYIAANPSVLVMFFAPWCGHCKRLKPEYESAGKISKGKLVAVDATKENELGKRFSVQGYPTLKYFGNGEFLFDVHFRSEQEIVDFMADPKKPEPPAEDNWENDAEIAKAVEFLNDENFESTVKKRKHGLVMFFAPWCGHCKAAKPYFGEAASQYKDNSKVLFAAVDCTKSQVVCKAYDVTGFPTILYFTYGKNPRVFEGKRDTEGFTIFMNSRLNKKTEL